MNKTYLLIYGGGFGDVILSYLMLEAGYIKALKEREPNCKIRVAIMSHNPGAHKIFEHWLLVDEILFKEWDNNPAEFFRYASEGCTLIGSPGSSQCCDSSRRWVQELCPVLKDFNYEQPPLYLSPEEQRIANDIISGGNFVAFHPFGGYQPRSWQGKVDIKTVIDNLCDAGIRVVLLGGSSDRIVGHTQRLIEQFEYERPGLVNLVNRHSIMLHSYICSKADRFIGAMSCFSCVAVAHKIPSLLIALSQDESFMNLPVTEQWAGVTNLYRKNNFQIYYFEKVPNDINDKILAFCKEKHV